MFDWLRKKEVLFTYDARLWQDAVGRLESGGVPCRTRVVDTSGSARVGRAMQGRFDRRENTAEYHLYVKKRDYAKAAYLLRR